VDICLDLIDILLTTMNNSLSLILTKILCHVNAMLTRLYDILRLTEHSVLSLMHDALSLYFRILLCTALDLLNRILGLFF
jgi:hypothetical protein